MFDYHHCWTLWKEVLQTHFKVFPHLSSSQYFVSKWGRFTRSHYGQVPDFEPWESLKSLSCHGAFSSFVLWLVVISARGNLVKWQDSAFITLSLGLMDWIYPLMAMVCGALFWFINLFIWLHVVGSVCTKKCIIIMVIMYSWYHVYSRCLGWHMGMLSWRCRDCIRPTVYSSCISSSSWLKFAKHSEVTSTMNTDCCKSGANRQLLHIRNAGSIQGGLLDCLLMLNPTCCLFHVWYWDGACSTVLYLHLVCFQGYCLHFLA